MGPVIPTTASPTSASASGATAATGAVPLPSASDFDMYLKMLTTQLRNQDPLNPMESDDYALQLATFAGVEQQVRTNELLVALSGQMALGSLGQMAGWVGQDARAAMAGHFDGTPITVSPNPPVQADRVELVVRDASGAEVGRSAIPVSAEAVEWAGVAADGTPLPSGLYSFEVVSYSGDEVLLAEPAEIYARITEVRSMGGETVLAMVGGVLVPAASVTALRAPA